MWALYNSYHYDCLDRCKKQNANYNNDHPRKKTVNINSSSQHKYDDIYCQGNNFKK